MKTEIKFLFYLKDYDNYVDTRQSVQLVTVHHPSPQMMLYDLHIFLSAYLSSRSGLSNYSYH